MKLYTYEVPYDLWPIFSNYKAAKVHFDKYVQEQKDHYSRPRFELDESVTPETPEDEKFRLFHTNRVPKGVPVRKVILHHWPEQPFSYFQEKVFRLFQFETED